MAVPPSVHRSNRPPRSPDTPAAGLWVTTAAKFAKSSTGDLRSGPLPAMKLIQAGRDTTAGRRIGLSLLQVNSRKTKVIWRVSRCQREDDVSLFLVINRATRSRGR